MEPTQEQKNLIDNVLTTLFHNNFKTALMDLTDWQEQNSSLMESLRISCKTGLTKMCIIIDNNDDWVIKMDLIRPNHDFKYCKKEQEFYELTCKEKVSQFFAATYKFNEYDGIQTYIQEYAKTNEDGYTDAFYDYMSEGESKEYDESEDDYNDRISCYVEDMENEDRIKAVLGDDDDIESMIDLLIENDIGDLHCGNWGTTKDGRDVMIDYSGFYG